MSVSLPPCEICGRGPVRADPGAFRAGRLDRAALESERLASLVRQPGLRALLTDLAAVVVPAAQAKRDGEA